MGYVNTVRQQKLLGMSNKLMAIMIIPMAIIVHSVLSWIFGMTLRPGWHSTIFGPYFVIAAIYSGTGALIIVMWFFRKIYHLEEYITKQHFSNLAIILIVLGAIYGYFTFSEYMTDWYGSMEWETRLLDRLFDMKQYGKLFWFANVFGVLVPILFLSIPRFRTINFITVIAALMVLAMWVKRYLIIVPTLETPLLPMQDIRPEYVKYSITWIEWALTFGGIATFALMFTLASKFIPIVPVWEMAETDHPEIPGE
jgi:molybdopterin-containing oxidoreductase family membrane subunit